ncbi:MAG: helix-turn-helix domain-containing protein [Nevskiaceae bacterium]|nr:MAG: helix-turn-helix domain-containing protein [Nevskiaceae bacterium]
MQSRRVCSRPINRMQCSTTVVRGQLLPMQTQSADGARSPCSQAPSPVLSGEKDLPVLIASAIQGAISWRQGRFADLGLHARIVLCELLRCVDKDRPGGAFWVRGETLAERLGCSRATLTRWLRELREKGWLVREQDMDHARKYGFRVSSTKLTAAAISDLGLDRQAPSPALFLRDSNVSNASEGFQEKSSSKSNEAPLAHGATGSFRQKQRITRPADAIRLPPHLKPLLEVMTASQVCGLMRLARSRGVKIEDVWGCSSHAIKKAKNRIAYIRSLITRPVDWQRANELRLAESNVARHRRTMSAERSMLKDEVLALAETISGKVFVNAAGDRRYEVVGQMLRVFWRDGGVDRQGVRMLDAGFGVAIKNGKIAELKMTPLASSQVEVEDATRGGIPTRNFVDRPALPNRNAPLAPVQNLSEAPR